MSVFNETLRYLGWRGQAIDGETKEKIAAALSECERLARPRRVSRCFSLEPAAAGFRVSGTELVLSGDSIRRHLANAPTAELMAATLGADIDRELSRLSRSDPARALLLDAAATAVIEDFCDRTEAELRSVHAAAGRSLLPRFSPGYGDLPLGLSPRILSLLDAERKIGLGCTASGILIPRKSVTAVMGVCPGPDAHDAAPGCAGCALRERCIFTGSPEGGVIK